MSGRFPCGNACSLEFMKKVLPIRFFKHSWVFVVFFVGVIFAMAMEVEDILILAFFPFIILSAAYNSTSVKKILDTRFFKDWAIGLSPFIWCMFPSCISFGFTWLRINPEMFATFPPPPADPATYPVGIDGMYWYSSGNVARCVIHLSLCRSSCQRLSE